MTNFKKYFNMKLNESGFESTKTIDNFEAKKQDGKTYFADFYLDKGKDSDGKEKWAIGQGEKYIKFGDEKEMKKEFEKLKDKYNIK